MAIVGFVLETRFVTIMALPVEMVTERDVGKASGMLLSIGLLGGVIGSLSAGSILDRVGNLDSALLLLMGVSIASIFIALKVPETGQRKEQIGGK